MHLPHVNVSSIQFPRVQGFRGFISRTWRGVINLFFAVSFLGGALLTSQGVHAEALRLAHFMSPHHTMHKEMMAPWAKEVADKTDGELIIEIFPARQLGGSPPGQYNMAVGGIADIAFGLQGYTASRFPLSTVSELPGFANSAKDATAKLWTLWDEFLEREYHDTKLLAIWTADISIIATRDKPIRSLKDLEGMRIRTPSRLAGEALAALGASPVSMPITEVYTSLERGIVDGVQIPASAIKSFDLIEVANYFTVGAPLGFSPYFLTMNQSSYQGLPDDLRRILDGTIGKVLSNKAASAYERDREEVLAAIRENSKAEIVEIKKEERARWLEAAAPTIIEWLDLVDGAGMRRQGEEMIQQLELGSERK